MISTRSPSSRNSFRAGLLLCGLVWLPACPEKTPPPTGVAQPSAAAPPAAASPAPTAGHLDAVATAKLLALSPDAVVIDVRTPAEFSGGHIPGATNIDYVADSFASEVAKLDREKTYVVHCAAGGRSTQSLAVFARLGFKNVKHLDGGLNGWIAAGRPVEK